MDRITRFARPHCYDASQGPLSFLDGGRRSRSTPRMNVDPITRRACPERQGSESGSTSGFANSRLRAQSTDSLTWRRAVRTRHQHLASRQHMSHGELRTGTVSLRSSRGSVGAHFLLLLVAQLIHAFVFFGLSADLHFCGLRMALLCPHTLTRGVSCSFASEWFS